ncbi:MAG: hypothetical protein BWY44_01197 [Candidatus Omnitrophica bacterium ADurb.Bin292]|nr:MAG: hypothetical protein BWY44_01197 [Candidatus Omnitrophica bacterium ADurb.Bin292]
MGFHAVQSVFRPAKPHASSQSHLIDLSLPGALIDPEQPTGGITKKRDLIQDSVGHVRQESEERSDAGTNTGHLHILTAAKADAVPNVDAKRPFSKLFGTNSGFYFPHTAIEDQKDILNIGNIGNASDRLTNVLKFFKKKTRLIRREPCPEIGNIGMQTGVDRLHDPCFFFLFREFRFCRYLGQGILRLS